MNAEMQEPIELKKRRRGRPKRVIEPIIAVEAAEEGEEAPDLEAPQLETLVVPAEPVAPPSFLERAKARLGFAEEDVKPRAAQVGRRLTKQQQEIVDLMAPIATDLGQDMGQWVWRKIGGEGFEVLGPSEDVASKIFVPWVRIAVRHLKFTGKVTPDSADATASLLALTGYSWQSWRMYRHIKKEQALYGAPQGQEEENFAGGSIRTTRANNSRHQDGDDSRGAASAVRAVHPPVQAAAGSVRDSTVSTVIAPDKLTPTEQFQYARLSQLAQRDIASRRRRSGSA